MKTSYRAIFAALILCAAVSCGTNEQEIKTRSFPLPKIPTMLSGDERSEYMILHYWDGITDARQVFPSRDSSIINGVTAENIEKAVADLAPFLFGSPLEQSDKMWGRMVERLCAYCTADTSSNALVRIPEIIEKYYYDPNSPVRDEDVFGLFAARMATCPLLSSERQEYYAEVSRKTALNRRGTKATNFSFTDRYGRRYSLWGINAELTVLFFSNPGCTACKEIITALSGSPDIHEMIATGTMAVLNIYIDEELDEWYKYMPIYPDEWYNGFDDSHSIRDEELYDVRAIPSLYVLDSSKNVILKDVPLDRMMKFITDLIM